MLILTLLGWWHWNSVLNIILGVVIQIVVGFVATGLILRYEHVWEPPIRWISDLLEIKTKPDSESDSELSDEWFFLIGALLWEVFIAIIAVKLALALIRAGLILVCGLAHGFGLKIYQALGWGSRGFRPPPETPSP